MKIIMAIACVFFATSCSAESSDSLNIENWLVPECSKGDLTGTYLDASNIKFGVVDGDKVCVAGPEERIPVESSIRFLPKKSGLNKIKFECDHKIAELIFKKHLGKRLYLFVKGKPFGEMRIGKILNEDSCSISAPMEFGDALALCETIATGMGLDKDGCAKPCAGDENVCAVVKESPSP